jgi:maltooligosyltrehalose synthase
MPLVDSAHIPRCTYRLQLQAKFTFTDLAGLTPYFRALGISDFYLSPIFTATPGSTHGYDVTDYGSVNPELGGGDGFDVLATRLRAEGFDLLLDFVPNHMGIAGVLNQWWRDVLENGRSSAYETFSIFSGRMREAAATNGCWFPCWKITMEKSSKREKSPSPMPGNSR